ncbi:TetR/AcrR family transcriptional regulator [Streptomyces fractus]|uniref:TetR/AcrR family transcriptional regulator n=1 Tax=Streptomyces fractus TaxID=641806 RepID=UPI003CF972D1
MTHPTPQTPARPPRRRSETRAHLIAAAADLFAERGTTNVSVEAICERAGFTRGAFYSNFKTVDDVFFALYEQRNAEVQQQLETLVFDASPSERAHYCVESIVNAMLQALPADPQWFAVRAGFAGQAQHRPEMAGVLREHAEQFRERFQPLLLRVLELAGRRPLDCPETFTRAVIAANVGAITQSPFYDEPAVVREAAVRGVILGLTTDQ